VRLAPVLPMKFLPWQSERYAKGCFACGSMVLLFSYVGRVNLGPPGPGSHDQQKEEKYRCEQPYMAGQRRSFMEEA